MALFNKLAIIYPTTWRPPRDDKSLNRWIHEWQDCLTDVHEAQVSHGLRLIKLGKTEFNKFPPNPVEFRALCLNFSSPKMSYQKWIKNIAPQLWNGYWVSNHDQLMDYVADFLRIDEETLRTFLVERYEEYLNDE